jgi:hypothetical protein
VRWVIPAVCRYRCETVVQPQANISMCKVRREYSTVQPSCLGTDTMALIFGAFHLEYKETPLLLIRSANRHLCVAPLPLLYLYIII